MENGYATLTDLESLVGLRAYQDVYVQHPTEDRKLKFRIQSLTEAEWSEISSSNFDLRRGGMSEEGLQTSDARLVAACLVDGDGNKMMRGTEAYKKVLNMGAPIVEPILRACRDLNNLRAADDTAKNLPSGSDSDSNLPDSREIPA